jgi:hypothetical protein
MTARKAARRPNKTLDFGLTQKRVEAAMRALPAGMPDCVSEDDIAARAEHYLCIRSDRLCEAKPLTKKQTEAKLLKIKEQSETLLISLMTLERTASDALYRTIAQSERSPDTPCLIPPSMMELHPRRPAPGEIMAYLQRLADAATSPIGLGDAVKERKGPDLNMLPREIARAAARDFSDLTGEPPTLSRNKHGFPYFLEAVFNALDIESGVADRAREAVEWWNGAHSSAALASSLVAPVVGK